MAAAVRVAGVVRIPGVHLISAALEDRILHDFRDDDRRDGLDEAAGRLLIAANRLPEGENAAAGGLVSALRDALPEDDPVLWFGCYGERHAGGPEDAADGDALVTKPVALPAVLRERYYRGFCNAALWPICHGMPEQARRTSGDVEAYWRVNREFAQTIHEQLRPDDRLWVHDYHLLPLGRCLRDRGVERPIGFFLHVPVPSYKAVQRAPDCLAAFETLASYDAIGVQTASDAARLRDYSIKAHITVAPVGIDAANIRAAARTAEETVSAPVRQSGARLIVGVDRLDYTKGLVPRLLGFDKLLSNFPHYLGRIALVQVVAPSRDGITGYDEVLQDVRALGEHINSRWGTSSWQPVHLHVEALPREQVAALLEHAEVAIVTPARDGMNLVAKEFIAAQDPEDPGVLVLSRQAGAADALSRARLVNAGDSDDIAAAIDAALRYPLARRRRDHRSLLLAVQQDSAQQWHRTLVSALSAVHTSVSGKRALQQC